MLMLHTIEIPSDNTGAMESAGTVDKIFNDPWPVKRSKQMNKAVVAAGVGVTLESSSEQRSFRRGIGGEIRVLCSQIY